jgi:DHA2 family multidrug resistance protein
MAGVVLHDPPYVRRILARIDVIGILLLAVGLTAMQLFLERGERENWFDSSFIVLTACVALAALAILIGWELWIDEPAVNLRVLRNIPFTAGTCLGFIFGITLFGSIFILPLFLQRLRGYSVLDSGLLQMPRSLIMFVFTPVAGRLYNRMDSRWLIGAGIVMMMVGYWQLSQLTLDVGLTELLPGMLLTGAGMSFMFGPMSAVVMRTIPLPLLTAASSLYTLFRRVGGNIGYAFVTSQVAHRAAFHRARLIDHLSPYDTATTQAFDGLTGRLASSGLPPGVAEDSALQLINGTVNRHATIMAYNDVFWMMGMLFVVSFPFLLLLSGRGTRRATTAARRPALQRS